MDRNAPLSWPEAAAAHVAAAAVTEEELDELDKIILKKVRRL